MNISQFYKNKKLSEESEQEYITKQRLEEQMSARFGQKKAFIAAQITLKTVENYTDKINSRLGRRLSTKQTDLIGKDKLWIDKQLKQLEKFKNGQISQDLAALAPLQTTKGRNSISLPSRKN